MKRAIATVLSFLILSLSLAGCGGADTENVSNNRNGMIEDDTASHSGVDKRSVSPDRNNQEREHSIGDDVMDDVKGAIEDAGDTVQDIGRGINDTLDRNDDKSNR